MNTEILVQSMRASGIRQDAVRIGKDADNANEQYCISESAGRWQVYYAERGKKSFPKSFSTEHDACQYLFNILLNDESVKMPQN